MCRGDHGSPANLAQHRVFCGRFLTRQTGTGEQCSPLQELFDKPQPPLHSFVCAFGTNSTLFIIYYLLSIIFYLNLKFSLPFYIGAVVLPDILCYTVCRFFAPFWRFILTGSGDIASYGFHQRRIGRGQSVLPRTYRRGDVSILHQ